MIAVTGASGYIGTRLVARARRAGYEVVALGRRPLRRNDVTDVAFDLDRPERVSLPPGVTALIHLAADTTGLSGISLDSQIRAVSMLGEALPRGARFVFVSSQSSRPDAVSEYGRTKWAAEAVVARLGGISVRPGLVYGGPDRGLYGRLSGSVRRLPILPRFVRPRPVTQPIHVDDLAEGLLRIATGDGGSGPLIQLAQPQAMPFDDFLGAIARDRFGLRRWFLPIPLDLCLPALALAERLLRRDIGRAQIAALAQTRVMDTAEDLAALGLALRPLATGLRPAVGGGRPENLVARKARLAEARHVLFYLLCVPPSRSLMARYARSLEARNDGALLSGRGSFTVSSLALAVMDSIGSADPWDRALQRRLKLALRIAEASPQSFQRFIGEAPPRPQRLRALVAIGLAVLREAGVRIARRFATGAARRYLQRAAPSR